MQLHVFIFVLLMSLFVSFWLRPLRYATKIELVSLFTLVRAFARLSCYHHDEAIVRVCC